jgi:hypothetical protein
LLPEKQADYERQGFFQRFADLLGFSSRHCKADYPTDSDLVLFLESNRFKFRHDFANFENSDLLK